MAVGAKTREATECRQCCTFCDKMIEPRGCIEMSCPFLYTYEDERTDHRYMGCLQKVFAVEIDVDMFEKAERTRQGFGGIKAAREPLRDVPLHGRALLRGRGRRVHVHRTRASSTPPTPRSAATGRSTYAPAFGRRRLAIST